MADRISLEEQTAVDSRWSGAASISSNSRGKTDWRSPAFRHWVKRDEGKLAVATYILQPTSGNSSVRTLPTRFFRSPMGPTNNPSRSPVMEGSHPVSTAC